MSAKETRHKRQVFCVHIINNTNNNNCWRPVVICLGQFVHKKKENQKFFLSKRSMFVVVFCKKKSKIINKKTQTFSHVWGQQMNNVSYWKYCLRKKRRSIGRVTFCFFFLFVYNSVRIPSMKKIFVQYLFYYYYFFVILPVNLFKENDVNISYFYYVDGIIGLLLFFSFCIK